MKKLVTIFFAVVMMLGAVFLGDLVSSNAPFSAQAQTVTIKRKTVGATRKVYRAGRWVAVKTWDGGKWVVTKVYRGGRWVTIKTIRGTRWTAHKTKRGGKSVYRKIKRAVN